MGKEKKITNKQRLDLETIKYFIPPVFKDVKITPEDEINFLKFSERGIEPDKELQIPIPQRQQSGYFALKEGKRWRGIHMQLWEEGVLDGSCSLYTLLGREDPQDKPPRAVVDFMKRELFKGSAAELIEAIYTGADITYEYLLQMNQLCQKK